MAIRIEDLRRGSHPFNIEGHSRILVSKDTARVLVKERIEDRRKDKWEGLFSYTIFRLDGCDDEGEITRLEHDQKSHPGYSLMRNELQEIGIEVMREFGFDPEIFEQHLFEFGETRLYPTKEEGLTFYRTMYLNDDGTSHQVFWGLIMNYPLGSTHRLS